MRGKAIFIVFICSCFISLPLYAYDENYYDPNETYNTYDTYSDNERVYNTDNAPAYYDDGENYRENYREYPQYSDRTTTTTTTTTRHRARAAVDDDEASGLMPAHIAAQGEKVIIVDPRRHAWGAYNAEGQLLRDGVATAGNRYCPDIRRACRTKVGTFRIYSLGSSGCKSRKYPLPRGGAPMPYCMFFNGGQGLHGSYEVVRANVSHGCVRVTVDSARWLRFNFVEGPNASNHYRGTKVIVRPY